jgi:hypothetical protein
VNPGEKLFRQSLFKPAEHFGNYDRVSLVPAKNFAVVAAGLNANDRIHIQAKHLIACG